MKLIYTSLMCLCGASASGLSHAEPIQVSGIYPSLAMFNNEGECGTGAVVPWADRLWVITYAPHMPKGSSDKLYEITPDLQQIVRPESIGGTPANRMIHRESGQLLIGPYVIDTKGRVRTIPYVAKAGLGAGGSRLKVPAEALAGKTMFGRHTANARHLTAPANKVVYATMEEGVYEVDLKTLEVKELWGDEANKTSPRKADLPGYHGKGLYSGQGVYVYANNGEYGSAAKTKPETPSGVLAEWDGKAEKWTVIRRNQFTEVTGPGGIYGNPDPATDPIWAVGWDYRSLLLGVRMPDSGWSFYRLPKGSHSYDGAHGWNTEWPRIREIGEKDLLMTMHGTFWRFPGNFTPQSSAGIAPRSNYLKVIGDFAKWGDRIVFGCDDTAKSEFLNKRKAKGHVAAPQSQSNLWFVEPEQIDQLGPAIGRGGVWVKDAVKAGVASDPYLFTGYDLRGLHLAHDAGKAVTFRLEVDLKGDGNWSLLREVEVTGYGFVEFKPGEQGAWIRVVSEVDLDQATAAFSYRQDREVRNSRDFEGLAKPGDALVGGLVRAHGDKSRVLGFAAVDRQGRDIGYYELDADLNLKRKQDEKLHADMKARTAIPDDAFEVDAASVIFTDDDGRRWRLPLPLDGFNRHPLGNYRVAREVATERDLCHLAGTFYELPARNAGDFAKLRPVASHDLLIHDFCSYRGLWVLSGVAADAKGAHVVRSDDGKAALWVGVIDDVWKLGKPVGKGGPWRGAKVKGGQPSDPYLMTGYDDKKLTLRASGQVNVKIEVDVTGDGNWQTYTTAPVSSEVSGLIFPKGFSAYWIRFTADKDCTATAILEYR